MNFQEPIPKPGFDLRLITPCHWLLRTFTGAVFTHAEIFPLCGLLNFNASIRFFTKISIPPKISSELVYIKRYHFWFCLKAQKSMDHKWQFLIRTWPSESLKIWQCCIHTIISRNLPLGGMQILVFTF